MENKVIFIIGLPGSGKTTFRFSIEQPNDHVYEDWMRWDLWLKGKPPTKEFNEDDRYVSLLNSIEDGHDVIVTSIRFCDHEFLCKAEYYLQRKYPDLEIVRYYFENNVESATNNVLYRDRSKGGRWVVEDGKHIYYGDHHNGERCCDIGVNNAKIYSQTYIIPKKYKAIPIKVMKDE